MAQGRSIGLSTVTIIALVAFACSRVVDFDRPLELPDFRDADTEVTYSCEGDEDCSALGPCVICFSNVCIEAPEADQDGDGSYNALCRGVVAGDDCDDMDLRVHPGAEEICNGADEDCDTLVDEGDAFGLSWTTSQAGGRGATPFPASGRTGLAWVEGAAPCPSVMSAFLDPGGVIRYTTVLTSCGEDVTLAQRGTPPGFAALYVDRSSGGADIHLRLLDTLAQPDPLQPEPSNISSDYEESDMPVAAWAAFTFHFGAAWLTHDTDDRDLMGVMFTTVSATGALLLAAPVELSTHRFMLTSGSDTGFGERVDMVRVDEASWEGFGVVWVEDDGIWIATVTTSEDGTVIDELWTHRISDDVDTAGAVLPSLAWAADRFVVAFAWDDPATVKPSPDVKLLQVTGAGTGTLSARAIALSHEFPREATYPVIDWHPDIEELGLAWADGRDGYGTRQVRFARLKLVDTPEGPTAVPVLDDIVITDPGAYASSVDMAMDPGAGFFVTWTQRQDDDLGMFIGYLECRQ